MKATHALLAKVNFDSFDNPGEAKYQYESYKRILQECNVEVIEVDIGDKLMLEDLLVPCNDIVIIPAVETQRREYLQPQINKITNILETTLGLNVVPITTTGATFRGSDVIFTGKEIFVALSSGTNLSGATEIADILCEYPCSTIRLPIDCKPLKRHVTMAGDDIICSSQHPHAQQIMHSIKSQAQYSYHKLTLENQKAANCLYVNGVLIHRGIEEVPEDFHTICQSIEYPRRSVCFYALAAHHINLTSNCILFEKKQKTEP